MKKLYFIALMACSVNFVWAQNDQLLHKAKNYLLQNAQKLELQSSDLQDLYLVNDYTDKKTNIEHAYVQQKYSGFPIYNAIANFTLKNGEIVYMTHTLEGNLGQRTGNQQAVSDLDQFAALVAQNLGFTLNHNARINQEFTNELMYFPTEDGKLNLSWIIHLNVQTEEETQILEVVANAQTGQVYSQHNHLLSCNFDHGSFSNPLTDKKQSKNIDWLSQQYSTSSLLDDGAQYRVYKLPTEAPTFDERDLVISPADPDASPYGWHDTNGVEGAEFNNTQGNNVTAVNDQNSAGLSWLYGGGAYTFQGFAEGGSSLSFDFPLDFDTNLYNSAEASTTNLFYMNNMMHDVWYQYGFTEEAGNFQVNNYGNDGNDGDQVWAFGQTGESLGEMNNARFGTPPDGQNPYMIMFMWDNNQGDDHLFSVNTAGDYQGNYSGVLAGFGGALPIPAITEDLVVIQDDNSGGESTDANDGCDNITNGAQLNEKIVLIRRGQCDFVVKVKKAQDNGAKAVVMVNNVAGAPIVMGGDDNTITIPSVMIRNTDGDPIIAALLSGTPLNGSVPKEGHWDGYQDGTLDNGVVAHEYGHGISNRLTGPPTNTSCLNNDEQMGEGWSDYFALVMTMHPGDEGTDGRGMATYAAGQPITGNGIRPTRYSTNMSINSSTYDRIKTAAVPHGVGYVWATMLWEMTWELVDEYGFDPDLYHGTGGNNLAMQLVIDGLKMQPCSPGFVTGRDAILEADAVNNEGVNQCRIWRAFAKRGLGYSATQGSSNNVSDGVEAFDMPPTDVLDCTHLMATSNLENSQASLYPNPTRGEVYILTEKAYGDSQIKVTDLTGKIVFQTTADFATKRATIDVSSLPTGVYVISIKTTDGVITKKLIKK